MSVAEPAVRTVFGAEWSPIPLGRELYLDHSQRLRIMDLGEHPSRRLGADAVEAIFVEDEAYGMAGYATILTSQGGVGFCRSRIAQKVNTRTGVAQEVTYPPVTSIPLLETDPTYDLSWAYTALGITKLTAVALSVVQGTRFDSSRLDHARRQLVRAGVNPCIEHAIYGPAAQNIIDEA